MSNTARHRLATAHGACDFARQLTASVRAELDQARGRLRDLRRDLQRYDTLDADIAAARLAQARDAVASNIAPNLTAPEHLVEKRRRRDDLAEQAAAVTGVVQQLESELAAAERQQADAAQRVADAVDGVLRADAAGLAEEFAKLDRQAAEVRAHLVGVLDRISTNPPMPARVIEAATGTPGSAADGHLIAVRIFPRERPDFSSELRGLLAVKGGHHGADDPLPRQIDFAERRELQAERDSSWAAHRAYVAALNGDAAAVPPWQPPGEAELIATACDFLAGAERHDGNDTEGDRLTVLEQRIARMPAATPAGQALKARVLQAALTIFKGSSWLGPDAEPEELLAVSLARDLAGEPAPTPAAIAAE